MSGNLNKPNVLERTATSTGYELYFDSLKDKLKVLRDQHNNVIQHTVLIMKEIDSVSNNFLQTSKVSPASSNVSYPNIKEIIKTFEQANKQSLQKMKPPAGKRRPFMKALISNMDVLTQNEIIDNSLDLFKSAKKTFQQMEDALIYKKKILINQDNSEIRMARKRKARDSSPDNEDSTKVSEKIPKVLKNSTKAAATTKSFSKTSQTEEANHLDRGYMGDIDSETNLAARRMYVRSISPNSKENFDDGYDGDIDSDISINQYSTKTKNSMKRNSKGCCLE